MLKARVTTALLLVAALGAVLFWLPPAFAIFAFALIAALGAWEWAGLMKVSMSGRIFYACVLLLFCWQAHIGGESMAVMLWGVSAAFWLLITPGWLRCRWSLSSNDLLGYVVGLLLLLPTWVAMVALHARGPWVLIAAMALVWVADIAAYFAGRRFGRHKLAPNVSPGKTWEGVGGAAVGVLVYGFVVAQMAPATQAWPGGLLGAGCALIALTAVSIVGDLFESLMKRQAEVKDSSNLLPGHGGVLDRIDSLTAALPLTALWLHWSGS